MSAHPRGKGQPLSAAKLEGKGYTLGCDDFQNISRIFVAIEVSSSVTDTRRMHIFLVIGVYLYTPLQLNIKGEQTAKTKGGTLG